jgi:hypothetical protein
MKKREKDKKKSNSKCDAPGMKRLSVSIKRIVCFSTETDATT